MNREEAATWIKEYVMWGEYNKGEYKEALDMAIKALEQEPCDVFDKYGNYKYPNDVELTEPNTATSMTCEDAISREATLKPYNGLNDEDTISVWLIRRNIEQQPPVNPQPKWIPVSERLPEEEQRVLVTQIVRGRTTVYCTRFPFEEIKEKYITAWMPLPAPFESYESEDKE